MVWLISVQLCVTQRNLSVVPVQAVVLGHGPGEDPLRDQSPADRRRAEESSRRKQHQAFPGKQEQQQQQQQLDGAI